MVDVRDGADPSQDHEAHDPELIVALLDEDLTAAERGPGTALIEACVDCARLHRDLVALAKATQAQPALARPRDFRLTAADAARLSGEPLAATTRLTGDMTDPRTASAHASHDTMLVASLADHSLAANERAAAERLIASCSFCAALHDDLLAIRTATIQLPTPPRPRDFQLTEADAARLRRSGWRRWVAAFGSPRDTFTLPLAVGLSTLGIIGILVSGAPLLPQGSATSGSAEHVPAAPAVGGGTSVVTPAGSAPAAAASDASSEVKIAGEQSTTAPAQALQPSAPVPAMPAVPGPAYPGFAADQGGSAERDTAGAKASSGAGLTNQVQPERAQGSAPIDAGSGVPPLLVLSGLLLVAGLGLFLLRWMARRVGT